ncbi:lipoprotein [Streptomyces malachitofuscus]|nr:lipoprotein [Streptomyces malachitofuscus]
MPFPSSPRARSGPHRRSLLAVAPAALLVAGCSAGSDKSGTTGGGRPSAADRARARAARDSVALAARYDAVVAAHPKLAERLRPLRAEVLRHAEAFGGTAKGSPSPSSSPSPSPSPSGSGAAAAAPSPPAVPAKEKDALAELAAAERELADRRSEALLDAPGELARLLASVAAAGAAHVYLLTEAGR